MLRRHSLPWHRAAALRRLLLALTVSAVASAAGQAPPTPVLTFDGRGGVGLAPYVESFEDATARMSFDDVRRVDAFRFRAPAPDADVNFGYSAAAFWLRFTVVAERDGVALLEVGFPSLDSVTLHSPDGAGGYTARATGDLLRFSERPLPHRNFVFPVVLRASEHATFYLRVASEGSLTIPLALWPRDAFDGQDRASYVALALYFGMLLALGLYNALLFFSLRDPSYIAYVAFAAAMAIGQASLAGFGNQFVWPEWPAWGNIALTVGFAATGFFGALFTRLFLATRRTVPILDRAIVVHLVAFALLAFGPAYMSYRYSAVLTSLVGASFAITAVVAGLACLRRGHPGARFFMLAWTVLLFGVLVLALRNMGWLPTNFVTLNAMLIGSALEVLLLSFALAHRIAALERDRQRAQAGALATAQQHERELEAKVAVRTEELAAANLRLGDTLETLERIASTDRLTGAWNRRWLEEAARVEIDRADRYGAPLSMIMIDVDHFKRVNDRHGHAVGDSVLASVAGRIREDIRGTDSLTRWGGEEFIVLTPGTDARGAVQLAEKLRQRIERLAFPGIGIVTVSLGVSEYRRGQRLEDFVAAADAAMYGAKLAGRNRVEVAPAFASALAIAIAP